MKPFIGVSMNCALNARGTEQAYLDSNYFDFLEDAGAVPQPIALMQNAEQIESVLDQLQGILFTGGLDINPDLWGEKLHPQTRLLHPRRQLFEFKLYQAAKERRLPILGICLGVQMINVAGGGSLYQYLPEEPGQIDHGGEGYSTRHQVRLDKNGRLYHWLKAEELNVPSCHTQGIKRIGAGYLPSAVSPDGVIEALEEPDYPFLLAVQWHPERDRYNLFNRVIMEEFLKAATRYAKEK